MFSCFEKYFPRLRKHTKVFIKQETTCQKIFLSFYKETYFTLRKSSQNKTSHNEKCFSKIFPSFFLVWNTFMKKF